MRMAYGKLNYTVHRRIFLQGGADVGCFDGIVACVHGLTEPEFTHILSTRLRRVNPPQASKPFPSSPRP